MKKNENNVRHLDQFADLYDIVRIFEECRLMNKNNIGSVVIIKNNKDRVITISTTTTNQ
jgi:predicted transcriptional regulator